MRRPAPGATFVLDAVLPEALRSPELGNGRVVPTANGDLVVLDGRSIRRRLALAVPVHLAFTAISPRRIVPFSAAALGLLLLATTPVALADVVTAAWTRIIERADREVTMTDINEELAVQYAMARRARPTANADEIAERITERLGDAEHLALAEEALLWSQEPAGRRELALMAVRNFVLAMESDPDDDPAQIGEP